MARSAEGRLVPRHDPETVLDAAGNVVRVERRAIARAKGADVTPAAPADPAWHRLEELAGRVRRLTVLRNNPHSFFEERSEIAHQLARLADELKAEG